MKSGGHFEEVSGGQVPVPASSGDSGHQNWGCNVPKPLWSSRLPIPIRSLHLMKLSNVKISSRIISYSASKSLILKRFDRHNEVIVRSLSTVDYTSVASVIHCRQGLTVHNSGPCARGQCNAIARI